jgi:hypothetical protein
LEDFDACQRLNEQQIALLPDPRPNLPAVCVDDINELAGVRSGWCRRQAGGSESRGEEDDLSSVHEATS